MKPHTKARDRGVYLALKNKFSGVEIVPEVVKARDALRIEFGELQVRAIS
jgi:hypothetical protein